MFGPADGTRHTAALIAELKEEEKLCGCKHWTFTDRTLSPGEVETIPSFPGGSTRSGVDFKIMGARRDHLPPRNSTNYAARPYVVFGKLKRGSGRES